jgi:predicted nucleic acid-binding protein
VRYLVDSNVLLRLADHQHSHYPAARSAVRSLQGAGHGLQVAAQNIIEFWNVATRPADRNGLGLEPSVVDRLVSFFEQLFPPLSDLPTIYPAWRRLVVEHAVSGTQVHDARLVATMVVHGITHILTFNAKDFARYQGVGISSLDPRSTDLSARDPA